MFLFNAYCFFLKLYLRVRTRICNFHFPHGDKCIRGIVHIFVIFSAKYEIFHNLQLLQRTLPSNFTKYKKSTNIPQFAASVTDTSKQFYIVDILTTAISLGHVFCGRVRDCSHFSFHQSSLIMFSVDIVPWQPSRNMYVENLE